MTDLPEVLITYAEARKYAREGCRICDERGCKITGSAKARGKTYTNYWPCPGPGCLVDHFLNQGLKVRIRQGVE